jgi:2'-5' RNA ligase
VLRDRLSRAVVGVLEREPYALPLPPEGFRPHLTIAYARPGGPTYGQVEARVSRVDSPPVTARISALSLVRLRREPNRWSWDGEDRFALRGADRSG